MAASVPSVNDKTFQKSKLNITINNYASKPIAKEAANADEMMVDLKAMRESLGLTPIKSKPKEPKERLEIEVDQNQHDSHSESNCILQMRSPDEKASGKRSMQVFSQ